MKTPNQLEQTQKEYNECIERLQRFYGATKIMLCAALLLLCILCCVVVNQGKTIKQYKEKCNRDYQTVKAYKEMNLNIK